MVLMGNRVFMGGTHFFSQRYTLCFFVENKVFLSGKQGVSLGETGFGNCCLAFCFIMGESGVSKCEGLAISMKESFTLFCADIQWVAEVVKV